jgi:hypothetical protein
MAIPRVAASSRTVIGAEVLEAGLPFPTAHLAFTDEGELRDAALGSALCAIVQDLVRQPVDWAA